MFPRDLNERQIYDEFLQLIKDEESDKELNLIEIQNFLDSNNSELFKEGIHAHHYAQKALNLAFYKGKALVVKLLLAHIPGLIDTTNDFEFTPLHKAAELGLTPVVEFLLEKKPELATAIARPDETILSLAIKNKHDKVVESILKAQLELTNVVRGRAGDTYLHNAAEKGCIEIVKLLLEANPMLAYVMNYNGYSALYNAASSNHQSVVELFQEKVSVSQALHDLAWPRPEIYLENFKQLLNKNCEVLFHYLPIPLIQLVSVYVTGNFIITPTFAIQLIDDETAATPVVMHIQQIENPITTLVGNVSFPTYAEEEWA